MELIVIGSVATAFGLDDVESETVAELHAGRAQNGAQGSRCATLLANHLTDVAGRDTEAKHGYVVIGNCFDLDSRWFIDQSPNNFLHQKLHSRNCIQSQTCFQTLSHSYTSEELACATFGFYGLL